MIRAVLIAIVKELRLLRRDPIGFFMLIVAPIAVIAAAGFSLSSLYGGGASSYAIAVANQDGGRLGRAIVDGLGRDRSLVVLDAATPEAARAMVREQRRAIVAIVIPAGTSKAFEDGLSPRLVIYSDPVRYLETVKIELALAELSRRLNMAANDEARQRFQSAQARLKSEIDEAARQAEQVRDAAERLARSAERSQADAKIRIRGQIDAAIADAREKTMKALGEAVAQMSSQARAGGLTAGASRPGSRLPAKPRTNTDCVPEMVRRASGHRRIARIQTPATAILSATADRSNLDWRIRTRPARFRQTSRATGEVDRDARGQHRPPRDARRAYPRSSEDGACAGGVRDDSRHNRFQGGRLEWSGSRAAFGLQCVRLAGPGVRGDLFADRDANGSIACADRRARMGHARSLARRGRSARGDFRGQAPRALRGRLCADGGAVRGRMALLWNLARPLTVGIVRALRIDRFCRRGVRFAGGWRRPTPRSGPYGGGNCDHDDGGGGGMLVAD